MKRLGSLFAAARVGWSEADLRYLIQDFLRTAVRTDAVYCDRVQGGVALVRVSSAGLRQAVTLLEFDVARYVAERAAYRLERLDVKLEM